jgi:serine/threonine protein kinase
VPGADNFNLTAAGDVLGTPEYMAPEQARDAHAVDIRADVYSLGCVLYHCLAGQPPFADASRVRVLVRQATEAPRSVRDLNPAVPEGPGADPRMDARQTPHGVTRRRTARPARKSSSPRATPRLRKMTPR